VLHIIQKHLSLKVGSSIHSIYCDMRWKSATSTRPFMIIIIERRQFKGILLHHVKYYEYYYYYIKNTMTIASIQSV
jgi:hypothetical protein